MCLKPIGVTTKERVEVQTVFALVCLSNVTNIPT